MLQTLHALQKNSGAAAERRQLAQIARQLRQSAVPPGRPVLSQAARTQLERLCARQPDAAALRRGLARSYRRTRRLGARALKRGAAPELWHRWRRRVKYLGYQARYVYGDDRSGWRKRLDALGHVLGELQDLQVLRLGLRTLPQESGTQTAERLIRRARRRLRTRARALYKVCFAHKRL